MAQLHEIGRRIKSRRIELGLTQDLLARASGLSRATINKLESGTIKDLSFNRASRVLSVLDLDFEPPVVSKRSSADVLCIAAQTASVGLRTRRDPAVMQRAQTDGLRPHQASANTE